MPGIAELAMAGAPIAGGALLGIAAGNLKGPDVRAMIKQDMDLLEMLPAEQVERRAELQRVIDIRIDDIIAGVDKSRSMRRGGACPTGATGATSSCSSARSCSRSSGGTSATAAPTGWLMFIVMILAVGRGRRVRRRGIARALRSLMRGHRRSDQ